MAEIGVVSVYFYVDGELVGGSTGNGPGTLKTIQECMTDAGVNPTKDGYVLKGWSLNRDGSGTVYTVNSTIYNNYDDGSNNGDISTSVNVQLFAVWKDVNSTITFNSTTGTFSDSTTTKSVQTNLDGTVSLSTLVEFPIKQSYVFKGWSTTNTGNVVYTPYATPTITENTTLYAVWEEAESYLVREDTFTDIANAIRSIDGSTSTMTPADMVSALGSVNTEITTIKSTLDDIKDKKPVESSDATAIADDIAKGKTAIVNYQKIEGTHECTFPDNDIVFNGTISRYSNSAIESVGCGVFYDCSALTSVSLPAVISISDYAFYNCTALTSVGLPAAITISDYAFRNCTALTSINLPAATTIGYRAFAGCASLTRVSLPAVTFVDYEGFGECISLTSVSLPVATILSNRAFCSCSALTLVSLPVVTALRSMVFAYCSALTSVSLPVATTISTWAFGDCSALTSVSLPVVTTIGDAAFTGCTSLTSVSLPAVTSLGWSTFLNCSNLSKVYLGASSMCSMGYSVFKGTKITSSTGYIYVPASLVSSYKADWWFREFSNRIYSYSF